MKQGDKLELSVESITLDGEAVGKVAGREVFCEGLFPGEQASVRVEAVSKHHPRAHAVLVSIASAHPQRRPPPCEKHKEREGACTGCPLMGLEEEAQREAKRDMLRTRFGLEVAEVRASTQALGYRYSSKRVAFAHGIGLRLGSFARGSHLPAHMPGCMVDHPLLTQAFDAVEKAAQSLNIRALDERDGSGDLRAVWGKTNGQEVILTLVVQNEDSRARAQLAPLLDVAGVLCSVHAGASNSLRGSEPELLAGKASLSVDLLGQRVDVGALGFLQPNPDVASTCYEALLRSRDPAASDGARGSLAYDLYAGAGITTQALRAQYAEVVPCESYPESARALGVAPMDVGEFLERELNRDDARVPDCIIANPPRRGLGEVVCNLLNRLGAPELRIMACGPEGMANDLSRLTAPSGAYALSELLAFDTLPQTPHVELVARLTRKP